MAGKTALNKEMKYLNGAYFEPLYIYLGAVKWLLVLFRFAMQGLPR